MSKYNLVIVTSDKKKHKVTDEMSLQEIDRLTTCSRKKPFLNNFGIDGKIVSAYLESTEEEKTLSPIYNDRKWLKIIDNFSDPQSKVVYALITELTQEMDTFFDDPDSLIEGIGPEISTEEMLKFLLYKYFKKLDEVESVEDLKRWQVSEEISETLMQIYRGLSIYEGLRYMYLLREEYNLKKERNKAK